jgi:hypothetical protein
MSTSITIHYKASTRERLSHPFSLETVKNDYWLPIAHGYNLTLLQSLGALMIETQQEAQQLVQELQFVREFVQEYDYLEISRKPWQLPLEPVKDYITMRIDQTIPLIQQAISEWDSVAYIYL